GKPRREPEYQVGEPPLGVTAGDMPEGEKRSPQDQSQESQRVERVEARKRGLEEAGETGPADHDGEHQPDVVDLPHRRHGVVDQLPRPPAALLAAGQEVPDAGSEIDAAGRAVGGY